MLKPLNLERDRKEGGLCVYLHRGYLPMADSVIRSVIHGGLSHQLASNHGFGLEMASLKTGCLDTGSR